MCQGFLKKKIKTKEEEMHLQPHEPENRICFLARLVSSTVTVKLLLDLTLLLIPLG